MLDLSGDALLWLKAGHIISVISWMAGLLYLPRLFVYHSQAEKGSSLSETLKIMERRLYRAIMYPALLASLFFGGLILADSSTDWSAGWLQLKLVLVLGLVVIHVMMGNWRRDFADDVNDKPQKFFRIANEVPTLLMIFIVLLAVLRPW